VSQDTLEGALVATHQEMELYHSQPLIMDNLQYKKESLQNQLINIRGELSQASSVRLWPSCLFPLDLFTDVLP
jgi:hypothetical protein